MSNSLLKKVTSAVALTAIVASTIGSVSSTYANTAETEAANKLAGLGVIADNTSNVSAYRLGDTITRREMLKVMVNLSGLTVENKCEGKFADLPATDWGCKYAETALAAGFIAANKNFRPNDNVSKAEALKMVMKAKGIEKDTTATSWEAAYVKAAVTAGLIDMAFSDYTSASKRGFTFTAAANATDSSSDDLGLGDLLGDLTGDTTSTGTTTVSTGTTNIPSVVKAGDVEVSLNPTSKANGTQIPKAGIVKFASVDFTAGSSDITLNTVELVKAGLASIPTSTKVWFEKNGLRISGKASFTSENNAVVSFAPAYAVKAGSTETLDLYVELSTDAGVDLQFASQAIESSAVNVTGSFTTPTLRTTTYTVASSTITPTTSAQSYNASSDSVELGKFTIANTDANPDTRDIKFESVSLYQSGTANLSNLSDIVLEKNGVVVSSDATVNGKVLTFTVNDTIKDGASSIYTVKAVVNTVELTTDTYQLYLKNTSDISLTETATSFRATVSTTAPIVAAVYSVTGGDVKFERDTNVSLSKTVAPGTSDVTLLQGTITAKSAVNFENIRLNYTTSTGANLSLNTVYLQVGTSTFTATASGTNAGNTSGVLDFLGTTTINGAVPVRAYVKLKDAASGTIVLSTLSLSSITSTKEYVSNQNTVSSAIGSISPVNLTIGASTLNVTRTDGLGATNLASGSKGVTVYGAKFSSTQGNEIALSNLSVTTAGTANSYTGGNTTLTLYVDGVAKSTKSVNTATVNFDNFNVKVSTTKSVDVMVKADFSDVTTSGTFNVASVTYTAIDNLTSATLTSPSVAGATFTIATAVGTVAAATGDNLVNKALLLAGAKDQKLVSFQVTATNDTIKLRDLVLTGANLNNVTNIRLVDSANNVLSSAQSVTATGASFANLDSSSASSITDRNSTTFFVIADVNSNTDITGVNANVNISGSQITGSNGAVIAMSGVSITGASHDVAQNTFKLTQTTPTSKSLATGAMQFKVDAFGLNSVTLTGATFTTTLGAYSTAGYTGATIEVYTTDNQVIGTGALNAAGTTTVDFTTLNTINKATSGSFVVKVLGLTLNSSTNEAWTVNLTGLNVNTGVNVLNANSYPKNTETLPLTSVK